MAANLAGKAFIPYYDHLMEILKTNPELEKTAEGISMQVAFGAAGAVVGGVIGRRFGALLGGTIGASVGYLMSDDYQSLIEVLQGLTDKEKEELVRRVRKLVGSASIQALTRFIRDEAPRSALIDVVSQAATEFSKGG